MEIIQAYVFTTSEEYEVEISYTFPIFIKIEQNHFFLIFIKPRRLKPG